jgi:hypothetical protein
MKNLDLEDEILDRSKGLVRRVEGILIDEMNKVNDYIQDIKCSHCGKRIGDQE